MVGYRNTVVFELAQLFVLVLLSLQKPSSENEWKHGGKSTVSRWKMTKGRADRRKDVALHVSVISTTSLLLFLSHIVPATFLLALVIVWTLLLTRSLFCSLLISNSFFSGDP